MKKKELEALKENLKDELIEKNIIGDGICDLCGKKIEKSKLVHIFDDAEHDGINILVCPVCHELLTERIFEKVEERC
jgi:ribosome-binding protein aMBF1 (putative translation factor)